MDVRNTDIPLPEGVTIRWLRVVQNFLKEDPVMDQPQIGYGDENTPRVSLGLVPVEADGSVSLLAPRTRNLSFNCSMRISAPYIPCVQWPSCTRAST